MILKINGKKYRWNPMVLLNTVLCAAVIVALALAFDLALFTAFLGGF